MVVHNSIRRGHIRKLSLVRLAGRLHREARMGVMSLIERKCTLHARSFRPTHLKALIIVVNVKNGDLIERKKKPNNGKLKSPFYILNE